MLDPVLNTLPEPTLEQINLMENVCKKLRFKYQPGQFSNPTLQTFYKNLEALVYDEQAQPITDLTLPDYERQDAKIEPFMDQIIEEFGEVSLRIASQERNIHFNK